VTDEPHIRRGRLWAGARLGLAIVAYCAAAFFVGCDGGVPSHYTPIPASKETDELVHGNLDPARIDRIIVYVRPPGVSAYYVEAVTKCADVVVVTGQEAARELVTSLSQDEQVKVGDGPKGPNLAVSRGTIRVVLQGGESLYLDYLLWQESQDISAPSDDGTWEGLGRRSKTWRSWLNRYVYDALDPGPRGSPDEDDAR
jgi:hypothetical protein